MNNFRLNYNLNSPSKERISNWKINSKKVFYSYLGIYVLFYLYYLVVGHTHYVEPYLEILQMVYFITYTVSVSMVIFNKISWIQLYSYIIITFVLLALFCRVISLEFLDEPFLGGVDSITYDYYGTKSYIEKLSFSSYTKNLYDDGFKLDDLGMMYIVYCCYTIFGIDGGRFVLLLANTFAVAFICLFLNKLLRVNLIQTNIRHCLVVIIGCFPLLSLTAGIGLKENFFVLTIVATFYYSQLGCIKKRKKFYILAILIATLSALFRLATFAIVILCILVSFLSKPNNKKSLARGILIGVIGGGFILNIIVNVLYGRTLELILQTTLFRTSAMESLGQTTMWSVQALSVIFGPFANFSQASEFAITYGPGVLLKGILGFYLLKSIVSSFKFFDWRYYGLIIYFICNTFMVILAGVALDMRYQITMYPITAVIAAKELDKRQNKYLFSFYIFLLIALIWAYNRR